MAATLTVREVCERALRKVGAYAIHDTGADPDEMEEAAHWLDMLIGNMTARQRGLWLVDQRVQMTLDNTAINTDYDLLTLMGVDAPPRGIQFPISATSQTGTDLANAQANKEEPVDIERRVFYDTTIDDKKSEGRPLIIYIQRPVTRPRMFVWPVPPVDGNVYLLNLTFSTYPTDATLKPIEKQELNLRESWNLWAVVATAAEISDGPVRKLPDAEVRAMRTQAAGLLLDLQSYEDQEHAEEPRRTQYNDF